MLRNVDHVSLFCDSTMLSAINYCFFIYFIATQNKKITLEEKYIVKRKIIRCEISIIIIIIMICQSKTFVFYIQQRQHRLLTKKKKKNNGDKTRLTKSHRY